MTDLGACREFLVIKIGGSQNGLFLSHPVYRKRMIDALGMVDAKLERTPLPLRHQLYETLMPKTNADRCDMWNKPYGTILGALLCHSTRTRPDISTAFSLLGKFQADPVPIQWKYLQHVVSYLIHTPE